jgi:hypothetical protein
MPNQANLEATLAAIEANPGHWDQSTWHCGTSHCFAGFAEMLRLGLSPTEECPLMPQLPPGDELGILVCFKDTRDWLGLTKEQWDQITFCGNTLKAEWPAPAAG